MSYINLSLDSKYFSPYTVVVGVNESKLNTLNFEYIEPKVNAFKKALELREECEYLPIELALSEMEFGNFSIELANNFFYKYLFKDIKKNSHGIIENKILFTLTFDRDLTPLQINGIRYGVIYLGKAPIFFYIYIDPQDLIRFLKNY